MKKACVSPLPAPVAVILILRLISPQPAGATFTQLLVMFIILEFYY